MLSTVALCSDTSSLHSATVPIKTSAVQCYSPNQEKRRIEHSKCECVLQCVAVCCSVLQCAVSKFGHGRVIHGLSSMSLCHVSFPCLFSMSNFHVAFPRDMTHS